MNIGFYLTISLVLGFLMAVSIPISNIALFFGVLYLVSLVPLLRKVWLENNKEKVLK